MKPILTKKKDLGLYLLTNPLNIVCIATKSPHPTTYKPDEAVTFESAGGRLECDGGVTKQGPGGVQQVLPAEQTAILEPALGLGLQTLCDVPLPGGLLVLADLGVHL